jgi:putative pyruvate formate lyase activating enzyme
MQAAGRVPCENPGIFVFLRMVRYTRRHVLRSLCCLPALALSGGILGAFGMASGHKNRHMNTPHDSGGPASTQVSGSYEPPYLALHRKGELAARGQILHDMMRHCTLCPRECGTDRLSGRRGECKANATLEVSSFHAHFGEERELVGANGSGTIFFTNCSLLCVFCINYDVSHLGRGSRSGIRALADMMLRLQDQGCHNINLVTPTHYAPHILLAIDRAAGRGLRLPIVYNTCGWEKTDILELLDGVVDVYLADFKYGESGAGDKYSAGAGNYTELTRRALKEMHRQVGTAHPDPETGLVHRGLMIRHLVMPENVARTDLVVRWIADRLPRDTYLNILSQYTPMYKAFDYPEISRRISRSEYSNAVHFARTAGLTNLRLQMQ